MDTHEVLRPAPNIASAGVALSSATSGNMGGVLRRRDCQTPAFLGFLCSRAAPGERLSGLSDPHQRPPEGPAPFIVD